MSKQIKKEVKVNKLPKAQVEITGSVPSAEFATFRKQALENINNQVNIDGFRKGKVPEAILISKVGDAVILEEMAELAISKAYPEILTSEKIDAIGRPDIAVTKLAADNPLEFKIVTTVVPEFKICNYTKLAKEENKKPLETFEVTDKEVEEAVEKIKKSHADHEGHDHDSPEAKEKIKEYLVQDKQMRAVEKKRIAISDAMLDATEIELPDLMIESETKRIEAQFVDDIKRMGVTLEDYLKHTKKTIEDLRTEWKPHAEKKAKLQLIINKIAQEEKIVVDPKDIEAEVKHIMDHYSDADHDHAYTYAETVLSNERVYEFLQEQK